MLSIGDEPVLFSCQFSGGDELWQIVSRANNDENAPKPSCFRDIFAYAGLCPDINREPGFEMAVEFQPWLPVKWS